MKDGSAAEVLNLKYSYHLKIVACNAMCYLVPMKAYLISCGLLVIVSSTSFAANVEVRELQVGNVPWFLALQVNGQIATTGADEIKEKIQRDVLVSNSFPQTFEFLNSAKTEILGSATKSIFSFKTEITLRDGRGIPRQLLVERKNGDQFGELLIFNEKNHLIGISVGSNENGHLVHRFFEPTADYRASAVELGKIERMSLEHDIQGDRYQIEVYDLPATLVGTPKLDQRLLIAYTAFLTQSFYVNRAIKYAAIMAGVVLTGYILKKVYTQYYPPIKSRQNEGTALPETQPSEEKQQGSTKENQRDSPLEQSRCGEARKHVEAQNEVIRLRHVRNEERRKQLAEIQNKMNDLDQSGAAHKKAWKKLAPDLLSAERARDAALSRLTKAQEKFKRFQPLVVDGEIQAARDRARIARDKASDECKDAQKFYDDIHNQSLAHKREEVEKVSESLSALRKWIELKRQLEE